MMEKMLAGRRVLVVEDEMLILMLIEGMLSDLGCESVTAAATEDQALALIAAQEFDAAMLDMNLNGNMSSAVANALDARGVPFIFSTGYTGQGVEGRSGDRDRPVLRKPFRHEDLAATLGTLLSR